MNGHDVDASTDRNDARLRPLWMRALGLGLIWLMVLQPTVATAAIAQEPLFSVSALPPNVMLMMDDSNSMREYTLPLPGGIALPTRLAGQTAEPEIRRMACEWSRALQTTPACTGTRTGCFARPR